jgi:hypothetical protein
MKYNTASEIKKLIELNSYYLSNYNKENGYSTPVLKLFDFKKRGLSTVKIKQLDKHFSKSSNMNCLWFNKTDLQEIYEIGFINRLIDKGVFKENETTYIFDSNKADEYLKSLSFFEKNKQTIINSLITLSITVIVPFLLSLSNEVKYTFFNKLPVKWCKQSEWLLKNRVESEVYFYHKNNEAFIGSYKPIKFDSLFFEYQTDEGFKKEQKINFEKTKLLSVISNVLKLLSDNTTVNKYNEYYFNYKEINLKKYYDTLVTIKEPTLLYKKMLDSLSIEADDTLNKYSYLQLENIRYRNLDNYMYYSNFEKKLTYLYHLLNDEIVKLNIKTNNLYEIPEKATTLRIFINHTLQAKSKMGLELQKEVKFTLNFDNLKVLASKEITKEEKSEY